MEENTQLIDQSQVAESVSEKIRYNMVRDFLVKPLEPVMVKKEFDKPVAKTEPKKDENGIEAVDYEEVETEVKEVESDFRRGVVLKVPSEYNEQFKNETFQPMTINVGDVVIYHNRAARWFDHLKDAQLVRYFDIICTETPKD